MGVGNDEAGACMDVLEQGHDSDMIPREQSVEHVVVLREIIPLNGDLSIINGDFLDQSVSRWAR